MKRKDITEVINALDSVSDVKGVKFAFAVLKNKKILEQQIEEDKEIFTKVLEMTEKFKEFDVKRVELCVEFSAKDENGNPITKNEQYDITDKEGFSKEYSKLMDEYKDELDARNKQMQEYESLMNEDVTLNFKKLKESDIPTDFTPKQLGDLEFMIDLD